METIKHIQKYRSNVFSIDSLDRVKVETIVPQNKVPTAVSILKTKGQTGKGGKDKILISSVNDLSRASSNETGEFV
jgi:nitrogen regulatory protein PII